MELTPTTRELILSRLDENKIKIQALRDNIDNSDNEAICLFREIKLDILKGENIRLAQILVQNVFEEIN